MSKKKKKEIIYEDEHGQGLLFPPEEIIRSGATLPAIIEKLNVGLIDDDEEIPETPQEIVHRGACHAEIALFSNVELLRKRMERLYRVLDQIESRIFNPDVVDLLPITTLVENYQTFHQVSMSLNKQMKMIHDIVADAAKFETLKKLLEEGREKVDEMEDKFESDPKLQRVVSLIRKQLTKKTIK